MHAATQRAYRARNIEKCREDDRERNVSNLERKDRHKVDKLFNPFRAKLRGVKRRARERGMVFNISEADLLPFPTHCPILGIELDYFRTVIGNSSPSVDRVNTKLGYVKGNVRIISNRANQKKSDWTLEELGKLLDYMKSVIDIAK